MFTQHWIYYNQIAQIWCQSEEDILSWQLSFFEVTARRAGCPGMFQWDSAQAHREHNTAALLEWEREMREMHCHLSACVHVQVTFRNKNSDKFEPIGHDN